MTAGLDFSLDLAAVRFDAQGLVTVVAQDVATGAVLMVAHADRAALLRTAETGEAWFWSRSRERLWRKGESSGNVLRVVEARLDCDGDAVLLRVDPRGPACHTGERTCFGEPVPGLELGWLAAIVRSRHAADADPASYTARLLAAGLPRIAQKVGEEATETVVAALAAGDAGSAAELVGESADLLFHLLVLLEARGVPAEAVAEELRRRHFESVRRRADALPLEPCGSEVNDGPV